MSRIIVITGPTATGKSALGVCLAKAINGEIISADSMQVYTHMDVGTAKPTLEEKLGITHHMIDIVPPWEDYSVARYVEDASKCVDDIFCRGKQPILVGGTGLYIDSLLAGRKFPARGNDELRRTLEIEYDKIGGEAMLAKLSKVDIKSSAKLHANDKKRIVRAFETYKTTGTPISRHDELSKKLPPRYDAIKIAITFPDRTALYGRIDRRVDEMLINGLEKEVRTLLDMGVSQRNTAMQAIGYKEISDAIIKNTDIGIAVEKIKMESRRYAKRQLTWLRRDSDILCISREHAHDIGECFKKLMEFLHETK